jgi:hypothetical protein
VPGAQELVHLPPEQTSPDKHCVPHEPQFFGSVCPSMQTAPHWRLGESQNPPPPTLPPPPTPEESDVPFAQAANPSERQTATAKRWKARMSAQSTAARGPSQAEDPHGPRTGGIFTAHLAAFGGSA